MTRLINDKDDEGNIIVNPFAKLITAALREAVTRPQGLPTEMSTVVISLIYKDKGSRDSLQNYRPIAVMSVLYKILTRCMADALQKFALPQPSPGCGP